MKSIENIAFIIAMAARNEEVLIWAVCDNEDGLCDAAREHSENTIEPQGMAEAIEYFTTKTDLRVFYQMEAGS
jgi:hypothetical protein